MHTKSRAIKSFITQFTTILLNEFPVAFDGLVFMGFSLKLIHDLDTYTTHSTAEMLDNVKAVENDFSVRKKFTGNIVVRAKHIHRNDFHLTTNSSLVAQKVISDDSLCSAFKNSDDVEIVKTLRNETHISLSEGILVPGHNLRKTRKIMLKVEIIELSNDS